MAAQPMPMAGAGAPNRGQAPAGTAAAGTDPRDVITEFRVLAQMVQHLGMKYPEFAQTAAQFLPQIEKAMAQVAGNPNRTPAPTAPPTGA